MSDLLRTRIEHARTGLLEAEARLRAAIHGNGDGAAGAQGRDQRRGEGALPKLRAAKAKLDHLESALTVANLDAARAAIAEAEHELDRAVERIAPGPRSRKAWADLGVEGALEKLRIARQTLADLAEARLIAPDRD